MKNKNNGKKIFVIFLAIFTIGNITQAVGLHNSENNEINKSEINLDSEWVVMIMLNGDNLLSAAQQQLLNQLQNIGATEEVKISILYDSNTDGDTKLYYLEDTTLVEQSWPSESNMADPDTMVEFVEKVKNDLPAQKYSLLISTNRGSGWQGILWDDTNGNNRQVTMPELYDALSEITNNGAEKLDVIGIETCMTGMTEVAYQIRSFADYFVAFEDCALAAYPPYSWPYIEPLTDLKNNPSMSPEDFATNFLNYFTPKNFPASRIITVLTVTNLNEIEEFASLYNELADYLIANIDEYRDEIDDAISNTRLLGRLWYIDYYLDPVNFLDLLLIDTQEFNDIKNDITQQYNSAVVECDHIENDPVCGLSLYIPRRRADYDRSFRFDELLSSYEETLFAQDTHWDEFLKEFLDLEGNTPPNTPSIDGPSRGVPGTEYEFTISAEDIDNDDLYYYVDWGDGITSGWIGPHESGEQIEIEHEWSIEGSYEVKVKAADSDDSNWETLSLRIPKNKMSNFLSTWVILAGKISDIETDPNGRFRFLPLNVLYISHNSEEGFSFSVLKETYGGFPCCGYIDKSEFYGMLRSNFIAGIWMIE